MDRDKMSKLPLNHNWHFSGAVIMAAGDQLTSSHDNIRASQYFFN